jgi:hypothetical protein
MATTLFLLWGFVPSYGQRMTEQFIPLGKSPGISNKLASIGEIEQYEAESRTLTITLPSGRQTLKLGDKTRIWLDRSQLKLTNTKGAPADLQKGRKVEVKYEDAERKSGAEWIKIELTQAGSR